MKNVSLLILFILLSILPAYSFITVDSAGLNKYTDNFIQTIKTSKYDEFFNYFFIPKDYTKDEIEIDKYAISKSLKYIFSDLLGKLNNYSLITDQHEIDKLKGLVTGIAVGNKSHHPKKWLNIFTIAPLAVTGEPAYSDFYCFNIFYKANFENFGEAIIAFMNYTNDGENFKVYRIDIILPESNKKSLILYSKYINFTNKLGEEIKQKSPAPSHNKA